MGYGQLARSLRKVMRCVIVGEWRVHRREALMRSKKIDRRKQR